MSENICERCGKNPKVKAKTGMTFQNYRYCKECRSEIAKKNNYSNPNKKLIEEANKHYLHIRGKNQTLSRTKSRKAAFDYVIQKTRDDEARHRQLLINFYKKELKKTRSEYEKEKNVLRDTIKDRIAFEKGQEKEIDRLKQERSHIREDVSEQGGTFIPGHGVMIKMTDVLKAIEPKEKKK